MTQPNKITINGHNYYPVPYLKPWQKDWYLVLNAKGGRLFVREEQLRKPEEAK